MRPAAPPAPAARWITMPKTRRYSIEIKDPDNKSVLFTAVDWTEDQRLTAVARILRVARLPGDAPFKTPAESPDKGRGNS